MRSIKKAYKPAEERTRSAFLWWPMSIKYMDLAGDYIEDWRWLQRATWVERYCNGLTGYFWHPERFI